MRKPARRLLTAAGLLILAAIVYWIAFLPDRIERSFNSVLPHDAYPISERARTLHDSLFIADLHSDSLLWRRDLARESAVGHMDIPRLERGNVALQVFSATTKSPKGQNYASNAADSDRLTLLAVALRWPFRTWNSIYERAVYQLDKLKALADGSRIELIRSRQDFERLLERRARGDNVIGALYLIEGAHPLEGDIDNLDRLFDQGLRIAGLTHFFDNALGGSLHGMSGDGLSEFGRDVVRRADQLGIIIDIAHASPAMVRDVLELSSRPVILSHGGVKGVCSTARNLDDDLMVDVAEAGGLLGIGYWDGAVCDPAPGSIVESIRYAIDLMGVEHVALGSDYDGATAVTFDTGELAVLTDEMLRAGFSEAEIRAVMGENVRRFLSRNLPGVD